MAKKNLMETAVDLLARREHARAELAGKLVRKGFVGADVAACLDVLEERGMLSDARYAAARARYRAATSRWGWARIAQELKAAGVAEALVAEVRAGLDAEGIDFGENAVSVARRLRGREREKRLAALVRKGYSYSEARDALDEAEKEA